jgi:hypothetical protein
MVTKNINKLFWVSIVLVVLLANVGTVLAAEENETIDMPSGEGSGGGMKLATNTFSDKIAWSDLDAIKPLTGLIILVALFIYGLTLIISPIISGTKINMAAITKSHDLRSEGQTGILHVLAGLLMVCIALIGVFILWNNFGPGTW